MILETKFDVGQMVWPVRTSDCQILVLCSVCDNTGKVVISGEGFRCPKCLGRGRHLQSGGTRWWVDTGASSRVGRVEASAHADDYPVPRHEDGQPRYMLEGRGTGTPCTLWSEDKLFATQEAAQARCDEQNALLRAEEGEDAPLYDEVKQCR
jgi:hypothetical protein